MNHNFGLVTLLLKKVTILLNLLLYLINSNKFKNQVIEAVDLWQNPYCLRVLLPTNSLVKLLPYKSAVISAYRGSFFKTGVGLLYKVIPVPLFSISNFTSL